MNERYLEASADINLDCYPFNSLYATTSHLLCWIYIQQHSVTSRSCLIGLYVDSTQVYKQSQAVMSSKSRLLIILNNKKEKNIRHLSHKIIIINLTAYINIV